MRLRVDGKIPGICQNLSPVLHREDFDLMAAASLTPKAGVWKRSEEIVVPPESWAWMKR